MVTIEPDPEINPGGETILRKKHSIITDAINPYFHIMLFPHAPPVIEPLSVYRIPVTHGSVGVIDWDDYKDYSIFKHDDDINSPLVATDAKLSLLREEVSSGRIIRFSVTNGSHLIFNGEEILDAYGTEIHCTRGEETLYIYGKNALPASLKAFAPGVQTIKLIFEEDTTEVNNYCRVNDYVHTSPILEDQQWSGQVYISGTVTTLTGSTITIDPGTTIEFAPGAMLLSQGHIFANGTQADSIQIVSAAGGQEYGIRLSKPDIPVSLTNSFSYCHIEGLSRGLEVINMQATVQNCFIRNCEQGIALMNADAPVIEGNIIKNVTQGIYADGCSPTVIDNNISSHCETGIFLLGAAGSFLGNTISTDCEGDNLPGGFYAASGALPLLEDVLNPEEYARNEIVNNTTYGIKAYGQSTVFAGEEDIVGGNSIFGNGTYDAEARLNSTIWAINNYWGTSRPSQSQFYADGESSIYYEPFLKNPPAGMRVNSAKQPRGYIASAGRESQANESPGSFSRGGNLSWRMRLLAFLAEHNHPRLIALGDSLLKTTLTNTDIRFVLSAMQHSSVFQRNSTFIPYLRAFMQNGGAGALKRLAGAFLLQNYLKHSRLAAANGWIQAIQTQFPNTELEVFALLKAFHIKLFYENDLAGALQAYQNLNNKHPEHNYSRLAKIQLETAPGISSRLQRHTPKAFSRQEKKTSLPQSYSLAQNYPNPFNPSTIIEYALPEQSKVVLKIYNMLGEEISTLVNRVQGAGIHQVIWNGRDFQGKPVASGVYIYRLRASQRGQAAPSEKAGKFAEQRKMVLIR